jgi:hypothetical protein
MLQLLYEEAPAIDIDRRLPSWPELTVAVSATWRHGARQLDWIAVWQCGSMAIFRGGRSVTPHPVIASAIRRSVWKRSFIWQRSDEWK